MQAKTRETKTHETKTHETKTHETKTHETKTHETKTRETKTRETSKTVLDLEHDWDLIQTYSNPAPSAFWSGKCTHP
ncbi:hypothetical protein [Bacillus mycoides]|uniref:hypothetical protein n=1 Tax=Bacillus mycoides TaxID=1405 RepID=UPI003D65B062